MKEFPEKSWIPPPAPAGLHPGFWVVSAGLRADGLAFECGLVFSF